MSAKHGPTWVGVAGFEPAASSSRTKDSTQAGDTDNAVTSNDMSHDTTSHPTGTPVLDAPVTHGVLSGDEIQERLDALSTGEMAFMLGWLSGGGEGIRAEFAGAFDALDRDNAERAARGAARR